MQGVSVASGGDCMQKFRKTLVQSIVIAMLAVCASSTVWTQTRTLEPFRNIGESLRNIGRTVEADQNKEYSLTEAAGPFLIFATALAGPTARQDANALVLELRSKYKWNAFVFEKDFTNTTKQAYRQTGVRPIRQPETQFAVLIGNFTSLEDNQFKKTLEDVRKCQPESLKGKTSTTAFSFPMAYGLANPMSPTDMQRGTVDDFIVSINGGPYSLLRNPRRYTVQIATFMGRAVVDPQNIRAIEAGKTSFDQEESALAIAGRAAIDMCNFLRAHGVEAYDFHDRHSSIVTVGSFDQSGRQLPDGTMVADPFIQQIMQQYQGQVINKIQCDRQPRLIEVPRVARK